MTLKLANDFQQLRRNKDKRQTLRLLMRSRTLRKGSRKGGQRSTSVASKRLKRLQRKNRKPITLIVLKFLILAKKDARRLRLAISQEILGLRNS